MFKRKPKRPTMTMAEKKDLIADAMVRGLRMDREPVRRELDKLSGAELQRHYAIFVSKSDPDYDRPRNLRGQR